VLVQAVKFRWVWNELEEPLGPWWTNDIHNMPCQCVRGLIEVEGNLVWVTRTSTHDFSKERLAGTHMLLCARVERETVVFKLSRESGARGPFHREDGCVLEVHEWFKLVRSEDDEGRMALVATFPRKLQGEQMFIG
jgi:hypothetical protein